MATLKQKLKSGTTTVGSWITLGHPALGEIMAKAGFEWLAIDLEHSTISIREMADLIRTVDLCGASPLVRLYGNDSVLIKRALDAGAHGIIVPMINSAAEARLAVESCYYPPRGKRGVGLSRAQAYGPGFDSYRTWLDKELVVIAQIEHIDAVRSLEEILSVEGIDGFIVGPYDLSASLGVPGQFDHPQFLAAMEQIRTVSARSSVAKGIHIVEPDPAQLSQRVKEGFGFIAYGVDFRFLDHSCRLGLAQLKKELK